MTQLCCDQVQFLCRSSSLRCAREPSLGNDRGKPDNHSLTTTRDSSVSQWDVCPWKSKVQDGLEVRRRSPRQQGHERQRLHTFSVSSSSGDARPAAVAAPGPLTALDSILTLQGMDDSMSGRSKGLQHGEHLLDMLDQVRDGLLSGGIPRSTLNRLAVAVGRRHDSFADPKLQGPSSTRSNSAPMHVELAS